MVKRLNLNICERGKDKFIIISALVSVIFFIGFGLIFTRNPHNQEMRLADQLMSRSIKVVRQYCLNQNIHIDPYLDPNQTGLIGPKLDTFTTSIGSLSAKRTTCNPQMAGLIVRLMKRAGVRQGDTVAVCSSGSFPALMIAVLTACRAMKVKPLVMLTIGASQYGATRDGFNLLDIYMLLKKTGLIQAELLVISLGGDQDTGREWSEALRNRLMAQWQQQKIPFIYEENLERNVQFRMRLYFDYDSNQRIPLFINCGGSFVSLGTDSQILKLKPGLNYIHQIPPPADRGLIYAMAAKKIPCLHLLFIKGLCHAYGLPWDPIPLPRAGRLKDFPFIQGQFIPLLLYILFYISITFILLARPVLKNHQKSLSGDW